MNSGNKNEEKLKLITLAYTNLKTLIGKKLTLNLDIQPDIRFIKQTFGIEFEMEVDALKK